MKKLIFIFFGLLTLPLFVNAQDEVWFENDTYKNLQLMGDIKGTSIKIDVTCSAKTLAELIEKSRKLALYEYVFIGFPGASPVQKLAESSVYNQDKDFFMSYINNQSQGLQFVTGQQNKTKTASEVPDPNGKKKDVLIKATVTVDLNINEIRKNLESQGKIKSAANIKESIGEITVLVKPDDAWLNKMGGYKEIDNQGSVKIVRDYSQVKLDKRYNEIVAAITSNLGEYFKIDDIAIQLNNSNDEVLKDKLSDVELQESDEDKMARTLQADIILEVAFESDYKSGKELKEFSITLTGIDAYTNSRSEMPGATIRKSISGDDFNALLDATMKTVCDQFKGIALKFLVKRDETGLSGNVVCKIADDSPLKFTNKITLTDGSKLTFSQLVDEALEEIAKKSETFGAQTSTRREYNVKIPTKTINRKGKEVNNDFEKFSLAVEKYISENLTDVQAVVKPVGKGKVIVVFTPVQ